MAFMQEVNHQKNGVVVLQLKKAEQFKLRFF